MARVQVGDGCLTENKNLKTRDMKKTITAILMLVSISAFSQKKTEPVKDTSNHVYAITLTEDQLGEFYQLFNVAKNGFYDTDLTGRQIKSLAIFIDSCTKSWSEIYTKWHPAKDSVIRKPVSQTKADSTQNKHP